MIKSNNFDVLCKLHGDGHADIPQSNKRKLVLPRNQIFINISELNVAHLTLPPTGC